MPLLFNLLKNDIHLDNFKPWIELYKWSPLFRSPQQLEALRNFFIDDPIKEHVISEFATGFVSHFEYHTPTP